MRRFSRCVPENFYKKLDCLYYPPGIQFFSKQMQDNTLLTVCTAKRLLKLSFFSILTVDTKFFLKNAERYFTYGVHQKTFINTVVFTAHGGYKIFPLRSQDETFLTVCSEKLLLKLSCL